VATRRTDSVLLPLLLLLGGLVLNSPVHGQEGTDIWVFDLAGGGQELDVGSGVRATARAGYDNQPHFLPGGRTLLFTSIDDGGNADILSFDLQSREIGHLTDTHPESEYSATLMPSGDHVSLIRVEADSAQRLWSFGLSGQAPAVLLPEIAPVGYHAWIDEDRLALFVLGNPATLQLASLSRGSGEIKARDIGRSLYRIPGENRVSFVQWKGNRQGSIMALDPETGEVLELAPLLDGNEFYAWTPSGTLVMGQGSVLFRWEPGSGEGWRELADISSAGVSGISRIAISPEGDRIAVVGVAG
jgi:dipeptidyl aminopeptidase/acylaminoacyl peptidase